MGLRCKREWQHCHSYLSNSIISEIKRQSRDNSTLDRRAAGASISTEKDAFKSMHKSARQQRKNLLN